MLLDIGNAVSTNKRIIAFFRVGDLPISYAKTDTIRPKREGSRTMEKAALEKSHSIHLTSFVFTHATSEQT